jgi:YfiR/HmsC-like
MKKLFYIFILSIGALISVKAQTTNHKVYSLFIVNIAKYTSFPNSGSNFNIVVVGKSDVYDELLKVASAKDVNGKKLIVTKTDDASKITDAQIIYLSDGKSSSLPELIKKLEGKPVMIISEREGLFKKGAGLSFIISEDSKLRVDVNKTDLEKRQIKISQNVLSSLAHTII